MLALEAIHEFEEFQLRFRVASSAVTTKGVDSTCLVVIYMAQVPVWLCHVFGAGLVRTLLYIQHKIVSTRCCKQTRNVSPLKSIFTTSFQAKKMHLALPEDRKQML